MREALWTEKYRPKTLDEYEFQSDDIRNFVTDIVTKKDMPHLLLSGVQGTGKSTLAGILINEFAVDKFDLLSIKPSKKSDLNQIRDNTVDFCQTLPMGDFKVVLIEEADRLSPNAQGTLRTIIEDYSDTARFILTCNYPNKIIPPIHSRTQNIHVDAFSEDALMDRAAMILENEGVEVNDIDVFEQHIKLFAPDLRKIINNLQQCSKSGVLAPVTALEGSEGLTEWEHHWSTNPSLERLIGLCNHIDTHNYEDFYRAIYTYAENLDSEQKEKAIVLSAEHLYRASLVADQEHNLAACLYRIFGDYD